MSKAAYETARKLAVAYAIHGPGSLGVAGASFERPMNFLLSVFKNSAPRRYRQEAGERAGNHAWIHPDHIEARVAEELETALTALAASEELKAMGPNLAPDDLAFLEKAADIYESTGRTDGAWISDLANSHASEDMAMRDAMADAARSAQNFVEAVDEETLSLPGGDMEPLRAAFDDLKSHLEVAQPYNGASTRKLEPAVEAAQRALMRYAHDGRLMVATHDEGAIAGLAEARALEIALDGLGYDIPQALWMDASRQKSVVNREDANQALIATLTLLDRIDGRVEFLDPEAAKAKEALNASFAAAGYLLPGESTNRTESVATQALRGTDDQILLILGAAGDFCRATMGGLDRYARATVDGDGLGGALKPTAEMIEGGQITQMVFALQKAGITRTKDILDATIVDGRRNFDFAFVSRDRIPGMAPGDSEAVGRRLADELADRDPEAFAEITQWTSVVAANDIEAIARFHLDLNAKGMAREEALIILAEGIPTSRIEDIEFGRAEGVLAQNSAAHAMTKGEAELVMQLVESIDKIVEKASKHPESFENAAFPVSLASTAVDAARRVETETSVRSVLSAIANGRRDAAGFSHDGAKSLEKFIGAATDAMKQVVAQDDYVMKVVDAGSMSTGARMRGLDEDQIAFGADHTIDENEPGSDPLRNHQGDRKVHGQTMWDGWADRMEGDKNIKKNFIAALPGTLMDRLIQTYETMAGNGGHLVVAAMAGREGAPSLAALTVGVDPRGYATIQEAMGMGVGGRDSKTKASLMEDIAISRVIEPKMEMGFADWRVIPEKQKARVNPYFMDTKVDGHTFPQLRPTEPVKLKKGEKAPDLMKDPDLMKRPWARDLNVIGTGRGDFDAEKRRLKTSLVMMLKTKDGEPNRDFATFLIRLQDRPIVAPTRNAAEALREVSNEYVAKLELAKQRSVEKIEKARADRLADVKSTVVMDRADAERIIQVWQGAGAKVLGMPTMVKHADGVAIQHKDLPTVYGRLVDPKPLQSLRDGHQLAVLDMNAMQQGIAKLGPRWEKLEIQMAGDRITAYGSHELAQPRKTLEAPDARIRDTALAL